ncbi:MAG: ABC transporter permease [Nocardioides sp.]
MFGYIVRRLISAALVLFLTSLFVFGLLYKGPRDPARAICDSNGRCTPVKLENLTKAMGLDKPVLTAYGEWAKGLVAGRTINMGGSANYECSAPCLGVSWKTRTEVTKELVQKYPATLSLALGGALLYLTLGVFVGVLAARWRGTFADRALVTSTLIVSSIPYYLVALLAWIYFTQKFPILPQSTYHPITDSPAKWFAGLLLPWLVLGLTNATQYSRFSRGQMVETLGEDFIRTATAKGQRSNVVIFKHALRAAIIPVVTIFGLDFGTLLGGTVFTEFIFDLDGMGRWGLQAVFTPTDIPVVTATVLVAAFFIIMSNLVVDIIYSLLDPRVRLG